MRPSIALQQHRDEIRRIALSHRVTNVRVFGSALHGKDTENSDLDLLVEPTSETTMMDIGAIRYEELKGSGSGCFPEIISWPVTLAVSIMYKNFGLCRPDLIQEVRVVIKNLEQLHQRQRRFRFS